ncbi:MAG: DUF3575 domain-containing protein [Prevotella sp.]|nr:DUF3575 domain-containing protein [Prevotella sp.]
MKQKTAHIVAWMLMLLPMVVAAQEATVLNRMEDTLRVQFRVGQSDLDLKYSDNEHRIDAFVKRAWRHYVSRNAADLQLNIFTGSSPEGPAELNRRLGEQRGIALRSELLKRLDGLVGNITVVNEGARWGALYHRIEASNEPWKEEVLNIIGRQQDTDDWASDERERRLRKVRGGAVWRTLNERYLPALRSSGSAIIASAKEPVRDTLVIRDTIIYLPVPYPETYIDHRKLWAVKTNLLLWGVIAPNVQMEIPLGDCYRWSIEGEVFFPWWTWSHNAHAEQFLNVGAELRYWLGDRALQHTLDGWHVGMGLGLGYYDFEWKRSEGWQGEYLNLYCNIGYQHRFGRQKEWLVDGGLALGYIPTKYRHYLGSSTFPKGHEEEHDDHLMWQDNGWKHIIGATHVNVTLGYLFDAKTVYAKIFKKER